jgi:hypothetical protein
MVVASKIFVGIDFKMEVMMRTKQKRKIPGNYKQQRCAVCKCQDKFNFNVPDSIWREIVPSEYQNAVVYLPCFDEFARQRNVDYSESIVTLYFAGRQASFKFETISAHGA